MNCLGIYFFISSLPISGPIYLYFKFRENKCCLGYRKKHCHPCCHCGCDCSCDYCCCCQKDLVLEIKNCPIDISFQPIGKFLTTRVSNFSEFTMRQSVVNQNLIAFNFVSLVLFKFLIDNQKTDEGNPIFEHRGTYNEPRIINIPPRRFENDTTFTSFNNDGTIRNAVPSAPSMDQIGQRDFVTDQRTPNANKDDIPTFEQVRG